MGILEIPSALSMWMLGPCWEDTQVIEAPCRSQACRYVQRLVARVSKAGQVCSRWQASVRVSLEQSEFGLSTVSGLRHVCYTCDILLGCRNMLGKQEQVSFSNW